MSTDEGAGVRGRAGRAAARLRGEVLDQRERWTARGEAFLERMPRPVQQGYRLTDRTVRDSIGDRVPGLAAEAALFTLISLPALLLVVLGSLGYVAETLGPEGRDELDRLVFDLPQTFLSGRTFDAYEPLARQIVEDGRADVIGIGLLLSLWTGSRAMSRYLETLTIAYDVPVPRPTWRRRLVGLTMTVIGLAGAVAVLPMLVLGPRLVRLVSPESVADVTLTVAGWLYWPSLGLLLLAALTTLYHVGVPWHTPWRRDLPGAVLAMGLWFLAAGGLRAYLALGGVSGAGEGDTAYQQLGAPIAVVLWVYVSAIAVLLGAELNAEIEKMWPTGDRRERERALAD
jgi:membrane protein